MPGIGVSNIPIPFINLISEETIPFKDNALFWLNGIMDGDTFVDKISGALFTINNNDIDVSIGLPYKSKATISAPVGNAAFIAADVNNFLYAADGTPNQIPVWSLFQDIEYEHRLFAGHSPQTFRADGTELYEPRVLNIVLYATTKTGADLTTCQTYYDVPTEDTTTMVWLSPDGNDTTGNGSKYLPYKTLSKIRTTTKTNVYLKNGDYTPTAAVTFTGATKLNIISTGLCTIGTTAIALSFTGSRDLYFKGCDIDGSTNTSNVFLTTKSLEFEKCRLTKTNNSYFVVPNAGMTDLIVKDCVLTLNTLYGLVRTYVTFDDFTLDTCYGSCITLIEDAKAIKNITVKHNKLTAGSLKMACAVSLNILDNKITPNANTPAIHFYVPNDTNLTSASVKYNTCTTNTTGSYSVYIGASTEGGTNAINGLVFTHNYVSNSVAADNHTIFLGGGVDFTVKYNYIVLAAGYGMVIKAGGGHYTTTDAHVSYNVFYFTGASRQAIYGRGVYGIIVANNTVIGFRGTSSVFHIDDNGVGSDNSMLCENNVVQLGGNTTYYYLGTNMTVTNNSINVNGHTLTQAIHANDDATSVAISNAGVPASAIGDGVAVAGSNNIGLASDYSIPDAVTTKHKVLTGNVEQ